MLLPILSFIGGLVLLVAAAEALVRGSVALAARLGVSPLVIGLTVVALGTSAPELVVCVRAALNGAPGIAWGNVVGSNVANLLLILGAAALLQPLACGVRGFRRDTLALVAVTALFVVLMLGGVLARWQGAVMVVLLVIYVVRAYRADRSGDAPAPHADEVADLGATLGRATPGLLLLAVGGGLVGLLIGAELLVGGAVAIALAVGVSETAIGLTMVAIGTSLPELAAAVAAARHGQAGLTVGNVVGSNIFNILGVMGATALITPLPVPDQILRFDVWVMAAATLILLPFVLRRAVIGRAVAVAFLAVYGGYVTLQFLGLEILA